MKISQRLQGRRSSAAHNRRFHSCDSVPLTRDGASPTKSQEPLPSMDQVRSDFDATLTELLEAAQSAESNSGEVRDVVFDIQSTLADHSDTLGRILAAIEESPEPLIIEPPEEPAPGANIVDERDNLAVEEPMGNIPESSIAGRAILSRYRGQPWYYKNSRGQSSKALLIGHLVQHGMGEEGLSSFTWSELRKIHGALHTEEESQRQYASRSMINRPRSPRVVSRSSPPVMRYSTPRVQYQSNCPGGRCPTVRRYSR